jgi:hypothetical protein
MSEDRIQFHRFPIHLANQVSKLWETVVNPKNLSLDGPMLFVTGGTYVRPPLPSRSQLRSLLEVAYLAGMETEETRPLRFILCCTPKSEVVRRHLRDGVIESWAFTTDRPFNVREIQRLAVASDVEASAIWIQFPNRPDEPMSIHGLLNIGSS